MASGNNNDYEIVTAIVTVGSGKVFIHCEE